MGILSRKHWVLCIRYEHTIFIYCFCHLFVYFLEWSEDCQKNVQLEQNYEELFANHKQILVATLSDVVDYRREYETEDAKASKVDELLDQVTPEQYTYSTYDSARAVISSN